jgi:hypothetical protein
MAVNRLAGLHRPRSSSSPGSTAGCAIRCTWNTQTRRGHTQKLHPRHRGHRAPPDRLQAGARPLEITGDALQLPPGVPDYYVGVYELDSDGGPPLRGSSRTRPGQAVRRCKPRTCALPPGPTHPRRQQQPSEVDWPHNSTAPVRLLPGTGHDGPTDTATGIRSRPCGCCVAAGVARRRSPIARARMRAWRSDEEA